MPNILLRLFRACLLVFALARCDAQVSPVDRGEALLTVWGSVEIANPQTSGPLVPALAFFASENALLHIIDVEVQGEFPSDFTLRVYEPPPEEAAFVTPKGSKIGFAQITAVTPNHPDSVPWAEPGEHGTSCIGVAEPGGEVSCEIDEKWCAAGSCYEETRVCPTEDSPPEQCEVISTSGDPSLRQGKDYWKNFAGLSEDCVVLYLFEPLVEGDPIARVWPLEKLDSGYYLIRSLVTEQAREAAEQECMPETEVLVVQRYNEAHGTDYTVEEIFETSICRIGEQCTQQPPPPEVIGEIHDLIEQTYDELECWEGYTPKIVENPEQERISIHITPAVHPPWYDESDD